MSVSRAFREIIVCHVFGAKKKITIFITQKQFWAPLAPDFIVTTPRLGVCKQLK